MLIKNIKLNEIYRVRNNPFYFKPTEILMRKQGENTNNFAIVKGWFSRTSNDFNFAIQKYFKPSDLLEYKKEK